MFQSTAFLFLACILAGFALLEVSTSGLLVGLAPFLEIVAVIVILIFTFALLYIGFKTLFGKGWR